MGLGDLFGSKQTTKTVNIPKFSKPFFKDVSEGQNVEYNAGNPANALYGQSIGQVSKTLGGDYLNPSSNPYLKQNLDEIVRRSNLALQGGLADTRNRFNLAGINLSGPQLNAEMNANVAANQNLAGQLGELSMANYNQERGNQVNAVGQAQQLYGTPLQRALATLNAMTGTQSNSNIQNTPGMGTAITSAVGSLIGSII